MPKDTEGNSADALSAFGPDVKFDSVNGVPGKAWTTDGNAEAALDEWGGATYPGDTSGIQRHGPVEMPGNKEDSPKADNGQPY